MSRHPYTSMTLQALRDAGMEVDIAERWIPHGNKRGARRDLFGIADIVAFDQTDTVLVQSTGPSDHAGHKRTILKSPMAKRWLMVGKRRIQLWSWRKLLVKRGGKQRRWRARIEEITKEMFR